jgi:integrase
VSSNILIHEYMHNKDRAYTHEEIQKLLNLANVKYEAIILTYASTGIRRSVLPSLKIGDIKKVTLNNVTTYMITVYRRTQEEHRVFCTPECFDAINLYLHN